MEHLWQFHHFDLAVLIVVILEEYLLSVAFNSSSWDVVGLHLVVVPLGWVSVGSSSHSTLLATHSSELTSLLATHTSVLTSLLATHTRMHLATTLALEPTLHWHTSLEATLHTHTALARLTLEAALHAHTALSLIRITRSTVHLYNLQAIKIHIDIMRQAGVWGLGFGVWGLGFGVWEIGRAHV